jgi:ADP-heptose:LPS heptosyltransferase
VEQVALDAPPGTATRLVGQMDLAELAEVLRRAMAVVCGNTGPAHLAAAVGTPVVQAFAPVVPVHRWRPWGVRSVQLGDTRIACRGCRARSCPLPGQPCLAPFTPDAAVAAVRDLTAGPCSCVPLPNAGHVAHTERNAAPAFATTKGPAQ